MKMLTIRQPHVGAIFLGLKPWETRSKPTSYRGRLGLHAAGRPDVDRLAMLGLERSGWERAMADRFTRGRSNLWTMGAIIGIAELVDCVPTTEVPQSERDWGDFSPGRWAWRVAPVRLLDVPIPAAGSLSFWTHDMPGEFR